MTDSKAFDSFVARVRSGELAAVEELLTEFEPMIRTEVRLRIRDSRLYRQFDSADVCQSVMASFLLRLAAGEFDMQAREQMVKLLMTIARRKVANYARRESAKTRDYRRISNGAVNQAVDRSEPPHQSVANAELIREFRNRLSPHEKEVADLRAQGIGWEEIATRFGGTAESNRRQWSRLMKRIAIELGLAEDDVDESE